MEWDEKGMPILRASGVFGGYENDPWYGRNYNFALEPGSVVLRNPEDVIAKGKLIKIKPFSTMSTFVPRFGV